MKTIQVPCRLPVGNFHFSCSLAIPRQATAFEEMILRIIDSLKENVRFNGATVRAIFENVLHLKHMEAQLNSALRELCSPLLHVLRRKHSEISVLKTPISDFAILENGQKILEFGEIPGNPTQQSYEFYFNFATEKIIQNGQFSPYDENAPGISKDFFRDIFPFEVFKKEIQRQEKNATLEVMNPQPLKKVKFYQVLTEVQINLSDGNVALSAQIPEVLEYLRSLRPEMARQTLFPAEPSSALISEEVVDLRQATWSDCFLPEKAFTIPDARVLIHGPHCGFTLQNAPILEILPKPEARPTLKLANDGKSAKLTLAPESPWEKNGASNLRDFWEIVHARVWFEDQPLLVPLGLRRTLSSAKRESLQRRILRAILESDAAEKMAWANFFVQNENLPERLWRPTLEEFRTSSKHAA